MIDEKALEAARQAWTANSGKEKDMLRSAIAAYEQARCDSLPKDRVERAARAINLAMLPTDGSHPGDLARAALLAADDTEGLVAKLKAMEPPEEWGVFGKNGFRKARLMATFIVREHYGSGAVRSAAERHTAEASALAELDPAQEGNALIPESAPARSQSDVIAYTPDDGIWDISSALIDIESLVAKLLAERREGTRAVDCVHNAVVDACVKLVREHQIVQEWPTSADGQPMKIGECLERFGAIPKMKHEPAPARSLCIRCEQEVMEGAGSLPRPTTKEGL